MCGVVCGGWVGVRLVCVCVRVLCVYVYVKNVFRKPEATPVSQVLPLWLAPWLLSTIMLDLLIASGRTA